MGVINLDIFTSKHGTEILNTYISLDNNMLNVSKNGDAGYLLTAKFKIWNSLEDKDDNKLFYDVVVITRELTSEEIVGNLYQFAYDELKLRYPSTTDEI
ncbi:MAG: hypothetical protein JKX76_02715 [Colwellia sp.]|nr:hypothetical protein [Colwellia sp.]